MSTGRTYASTELIRSNQINQLFDQAVNKDVRYRFIIDFAPAKPRA